MGWGIYVRSWDFSVVVREVHDSQRSQCWQRGSHVGSDGERALDQLPAAPGILQGRGDSIGIVIARRGGENQLAALICTVELYFEWLGGQGELDFVVGYVDIDMNGNCLRGRIIECHFRRSFSAAAGVVGLGDELLVCV